MRAASRRATCQCVLLTVRSVAIAPRRAPGYTAIVTRALRKPERTLVEPAGTGSATMAPARVTPARWRLRRQSNEPDSAHRPPRPATRSLKRAIHGGIPHALSLAPHRRLCEQPPARRRLRRAHRPASNSRPVSVERRSPARPAGASELHAAGDVPVHARQRAGRWLTYHARDSAVDGVRPVWASMGTVAMRERRLPRALGAHRHGLYALPPTRNVTAGKLPTVRARRPGDVGVIDAARRGAAGRSWFADQVTCPANLAASPPVQRQRAADRGANAVNAAARRDRESAEVRHAGQRRRETSVQRTRRREITHGKLAEGGTRPGSEVAVHELQLAPLHR